MQGVNLVSIGTGSRLRDQNKPQHSNSRDISMGALVLMPPSPREWFNGLGWTFCEQWVASQLRNPRPRAKCLNSYQPDWNKVTLVPIWGRSWGVRHTPGVQLSPGRWAELNSPAIVQVSRTAEKFWSHSSFFFSLGLRWDDKPSSRVIANCSCCLTQEDHVIILWCCSTGSREWRKC